VIRFVSPDVHTARRHRQVMLNHLNERAMDTNKLALDQGVQSRRGIRTDL
jgi:hypothetical protein